MIALPFGVLLWCLFLAAIGWNMFPDIIKIPLIAGLIMDVIWLIDWCIKTNKLADEIEVKLIEDREHERQWELDSELKDLVKWEKHFREYTDAPNQMSRRYELNIKNFNAALVKYDEYTEELKRRIKKGSIRRSVFLAKFISLDIKGTKNKDRFFWRWYSDTANTWQFHVDYYQKKDMGSLD